VDLISATVAYPVLSECLVVPILVNSVPNPILRDEQNTQAGRHSIQSARIRNVRDGRL
jgi:hypothetical protein